MFLETDLTYNDNGDLLHFFDNECFRKSFHIYSNSQLSLRDHFVLMYTNERAAKKKRSDEWNQLQNMIINAQDNGWTILENLWRHKHFKLLRLYREYMQRDNAAEAVELQPVQKLLKAFFEAVPDISEEMQSAMAKYRTALEQEQQGEEENIFPEREFNAQVAMMSTPLPFFHFRDWNEVTRDPKIKLESNTQRIRREWTAKYGNRWYSLTQQFPPK